MSFPINLLGHILHFVTLFTDYLIYHHIYSEVDSPITRAEVATVIKKLHCGRAPAVDDLCPEFLKALDVVGISWLRLGSAPLQHRVDIGGSNSGLADLGGFSPFSDGEPEAVFQLQRNLWGMGYWVCCYALHNPCTDGASLVHIVGFVGFVFC